MKYEIRCAVVVCRIEKKAKKTNCCTSLYFPMFVYFFVSVFLFLYSVLSVRFAATFVLDQKEQQQQQQVKIN